MRVICGPCHVRMKMEKSGVLAEELTETRDGYQIWSTDHYLCPKCKAAICMTGTGQKPLAEHFEDGYKEFAAKADVWFV